MDPKENILTIVVMFLIDALIILIKYYFYWHADDERLEREHEFTL